MDPSDTPKNPELPSSMSPSFKEYQPESWAMLKDTIYAARTALEAGIEYTQELLADHETRLGRTTRSNRYRAEMMEKDIRAMILAREALRSPNGQFHSMNEIAQTRAQKKSH